MTNVTRKITPPQEKALKWLNDQGGSGQFDGAGQQITANGLTIHYKRDIWVGLRDAGRIEFYNDGQAATPFGGVRILRGNGK